MNANLALYQAFVENVRELDRAWRINNAILNSTIRTNKIPEQKVYTNLLLFIQSAHSESLFYKTLYTPYGLSDYEIAHIHGYAKRNSVGDNWKKLVQLGLKKVKRKDKGGYNTLLQTISRYVDEYVISPSQVRNKIAHGQWKVGLNNDCTQINAQNSAKISGLNVIEIARWKAGFEALAEIAEIMVESPEKAFHRTLSVEMARLESKLNKMRRWTMASKKQQLSRKPIKFSQ